MVKEDGEGDVSPPAKKGRRKEKNVRNNGGLTRVGEKSILEIVPFLGRKIPSIPKFLVKFQSW